MATIERSPFALAIFLAASVVVAASSPEGQTVAIAGRVIDSKTGGTIGEAVVSLIRMPSEPSAKPTPPLDAVRTERDGRFYFPDVQRGAYQIVATKQGYMDGAYGKTRHFGLPKTLEVSAAASDLRIEMWRPAVLVGQVFDANGAAAVGVKVGILQRHMLSGRRLFEEQASAVTDDRGIFRSPALQPGTYTACVISRQTVVPANLFGAYSTGRLLIDRQLRRQLPILGPEPPPPGSPQLNRIKDQVSISSNGLGPLGDLSIQGSACSEATNSLSDAVLASLDAGDVSDPLTIHLRKERGFVLSGRLSDPNGPVPNTAVRLLSSISQALLRDAGYETALSVTDSAGRFTMLGVPSGEYILDASVMAGDLRPGGIPENVVNLRWLSTRVVVPGTDVVDLDLQLQEGFQIKGRIEFEGPEASRPLFSRLSPQLEPADGRSRRLIPATPAPDGSFVVNDVPPGRYLLRAPPTSGWTLRDAVLDGRDISDEAFDVSQTTSSVVATFTTRTGEVIVLPNGPSGSFDAKVTVFAASTDRKYWVDYGWNPRRLRQARPDAQGAVRLAGLPPGEYFVGALVIGSGMTWRQSDEPFDLISRQGVRFKIAAGETLQIRVPVVAGAR